METIDFWESGDYFGKIKSLEALYQRWLSKPPTHPQPVVGTATQAGNYGGARRSYAFGQIFIRSDATPSQHSFSKSNLHDISWLAGNLLSAKGPIDCISMTKDRMKSLETQVYAKLIKTGDQGGGGGYDGVQGDYHRTCGHSRMLYVYFPPFFRTESLL